MSEIDNTKLTGMSGRNDLPDLPKWGLLLNALDAADNDLPTKLSGGAVCHDWEKVWLDIFVDGSGTLATATVKVWFWSEMASVSEADGVYTYTGGWVEQDIISDIAVEAGDAGHKQALLTVDGRSFCLEVTALGTDAVFYASVSGAKRRSL